MRIGIVITNPNHHLDLTLPVAKQLNQAGIDVKYISFCELRRMRSPTDVFDEASISYSKFSDLPKQLKPSSGKQSLGSSDSLLRLLVRKAFWYLKIKPFVQQNFKDLDRVLILNDAAFPGDSICRWLASRNIPFYLLQEGIRFPLPTETESTYGANGASKVLAWGERSAKHFRSVVKHGTEVEVTGSPRFNTFLDRVEKEGTLPETTRVLGVFTNPIDDQGFCSKQDKLDLFESFVKRSAKYLELEKVEVLIKTHPREEVNDYLQIANKYLSKVSVAPQSIFEAIMAVHAGVIMASTVGLELLGAGRSIAQLEIPDFGYVFDYTDDAGTVKVPVSGEVNLAPLFEPHFSLGYFEEHIHRQNSTENIYQALIS